VGCPRLSGAKTMPGLRLGTSSGAELGGHRAKVLPGPPSRATLLSSRPPMRTMMSSAGLPVRTRAGPGLLCSRAPNSEL